MHLFLTLIIFVYDNYKILLKNKIVRKEQLYSQQISYKNLKRNYLKNSETINNKKKKSITTH